MATKLDIVRGALHRLQILAIDEQPEAHDEAHASQVLDSLFLEAMGPTWGMLFDFTLDDEDIPTEYVLPLSLALAVEVATDYGVPAPATHKTAMIRLRALNRPYVRDFDLDDVDDPDIEAHDRGAYF